MVCTLNNKLGTIKLSWASSVETVLFIQTTVVKTSGGLVRGCQGHHYEAEHEGDHGHAVQIKCFT